jgi:hypothetical protein
MNIRKKEEGAEWSGEEDDILDATTLQSGKKINISKKEKGVESSGEEDDILDAIAEWQENKH